MFEVEFYMLLTSVNLSFPHILSVWIIQMPPALWFLSLNQEGLAKSFWKAKASAAGQTNCLLIST